MLEQLQFRPPNLEGSTAKNRGPKLKLISNRYINPDLYFEVDPICHTKIPLISPHLPAAPPLHPLPPTDAPRRHAPALPIRAGSPSGPPIRAGRTRLSRRGANATTSNPEASHSGPRCRPTAPASPAPPRHRGPRQQPAPRSAIGVVVLRPHLQVVVVTPEGWHACCYSTTSPEGWRA